MRHAARNAQRADERYSQDAGVDVIGEHLALIRAIFCHLTNEKDPNRCAVGGPHWETVGFQQNDPTTDLNRSMGVLALVQALHLCETQPALARELMAAAQDPMGRDWPFMCTGLGFTKQALVALRRGDVYRECNGRGEVRARTVCRPSLSLGEEP